jgi:prepilin-type processing-associated H-X9-DG protein
MVHGELVELGLVDPAALLHGVMGMNSLTRLSEVTDGASNTILITEDAGRPRRWQAGRQVPGLSVGGGAWSSSGNRIIVRGSTRDGAMRPGPCAINCTNDHEVYSFHSGGANAVFADGSVHFLKATMDIRIFARLVTRAGGEVVSVSDY